ncbi:MAG: SDR family oxidoreductase [Candidatus Kerfeldbacteria bacterium]|nr:SDR family oxidoreductase [Candidatus Kerfeldbacteria bacterium]
MEIQNAVTVITGASRGLGKSLAKTFIQRGAKVILCSNNEEELKMIAHELGGMPVLCDVTDEQQVLHVADVATKVFGRLDLWINNAGIWIPHMPADEMDLSKVHQMVEVNLFGTIHGCRAALSIMKPQHHGAIVNILSTSALRGRPGSSGYCASKYAAVGFTKSLRMEVAPEIRVFGVYPGGMKTEIFGQFRPEGYDHFMDPDAFAEKVVENLCSENPEEEFVIERIEA